MSNLMMNILDEDNNVVEVEYEEYKNIPEEVKDRRYIKQTTLENGVWVSTILLSMTILEDWKFETMAFPSHGEWLEIDCVRSASYEQALQAHEQICDEQR